MIASGNIDSTKLSRVADKLFKYDIVLAPYNLYAIALTRHFTVNTLLTHDTLRPSIQ
jgi:hypothetical protein